MSTARLACAAYIRTSTDDQQSPEDSRRWQLDIASRLVATAAGKTLIKEARSGHISVTCDEVLTA